MAGYGAGRDGSSAIFWRATLAIAALYYVTVPPAERAATESQLRETAAGLPAQVVSLCQANPAACASLVQQASGGLTGGITTLATVPHPAPAAVTAPASALPAPGDAALPRQLVDHAPLPPRRPALMRGQNGA